VVTEVSIAAVRQVGYETIVVVVAVEVVAFAHRRRRAVGSSGLRPIVTELQPPSWLPLCGVTYGTTTVTYVRWRLAVNSLEFGHEKGRSV